MTFPFLLYIDPGTGSMLVSLFIGVALAVSFSVRALFVKIKFLISGGKVKAEEKQNAPFVIFSDHKRYWNIFKPICDEFENRKIPLEFYTASSDDPALSAKYEFVKSHFLGEGNKAFARLSFINADIMLSTTPGLDVYQWKKSKKVKCYVHIPHTVDDLSGYRMFGLDFYDAVLTSGQNQTELICTIEGMRNIQKKELFTVGSVPLDNLAARLKHNPSVQNNGTKTILVAPSWGVNGILSRFGSELLEALEKTGFNIIVRPHPQTVVSEQNILQPLQEKFKDSKNIIWNFDNDNFECLSKADLLITDFSGIIFDYLLVFDKPLLYADTKFDTLPYDADWLTEPMWTLRVLPKIGKQLEQSDFANIKEVIESAIESEEFKKGRDSVRNECWENRLNAAKSAVDWMIDKQKKLSEKGEN